MIIVALTVLGAVTWLAFGWWAGALWRQSFIDAHLGWRKKNEIPQRIWILGGGVSLFTFSLAMLIRGSMCICFTSVEYQYYCTEYLQLPENRFPSWFGKSSDYDKIPPPEISVNL